MQKGMFRLVQEVQKKILLLGGSAQQIVAIETAKRLGYYTILCDFLPDNPGQYYSDKFFLVSTTDKEAILSIAKNEQVNGVLAYASDPAAPTAAYVAEKIGLPGNPYSSVDTLCNKDKFRVFLQENGFNTPRSYSCSSAEEVFENIRQLNLPVIVKPVDSSGSKGITVLHSLENLKEAVEFAFAFSRSNRIIVEEFIEKNHPYLIGGDIFIVNGKVVLWGMLNCHRSNLVNPLVPVGKSYPLELSCNDIQNVQITLQTMIDKLHIDTCAMNVELVIDKNSKVWLIDVGPRSGGNMIPDLLSLIFGIDIVEMSVKAAMGESLKIELNDGVPYYATYNLHSKKNGKFNELRYSEKIKSHIVKECIYKKKGDTVKYFDNASKALGIIFLKFGSLEEMQLLLSDIDKHVKVIVS